MFEKYIIDSLGSVRMDQFDPEDTLDLNKKKARQECDRLRQRFSELQEVLYASKKFGLLIVLQGMDCSGKDGAVQNVLTGVNPTGFNVKAMKIPTSDEVGHGYLWRAQKKTPQKGNIVVFNRSYYEDVLVNRVHGQVDDETAYRRFEEIRNFEEYLVNNHTVLIKFFLHISKDFQKGKLLKRLKDPKKHWKFSQNDLEERKYWDDYQRCYSDVLSRCSSKRAPWYVVPSNHRWFRDYFILKTIVQTLEELQLEYPVIQDNIRSLIQALEEGE